MIKVAVLDLLDGELSITVSVKSLKYLGQVVPFALREELGGDEGKGGALEGLVGLEILQVSQGSNDLYLIDLGVDQLGDPFVLEGVLSRRSILRLVSEKLGNEIFGRAADGLPRFIVEVELA